MKYTIVVCFCLMLVSFLAGMDAFAHGIDQGSKNFFVGNDGVAFIPFLYIGAKHMVTGYDHLLFLIGVIFFLYRFRDILLYVSFFTIGHSVTLLLGVLANISINAYLIDSIIALSIVYKGFDNLGGFKRIFGFEPNLKGAVLIFGLFHGFGLASKLQEFEFGRQGLVTNLIGFNIGVEIGQFVALAMVLLLITFWRQYPSFFRFSTIANTLLMAAGFVLMGYQLTGYLTQ